MDSGKIKALATGARSKLMDGVRASLERVLAPDSTESINDKSHVAELRDEAKDRDALVERVAYTWFNRLCALRLMDSRGYTPVSVVTPRAGETMPAILADARRGVFCPEFPLKKGDRQKVVDLLSGSTGSVNPLGEAYVILLLSACDHYAKPIPDLFGADLGTVNAMRLLAPTSLLSEGSVLQGIVEGMDDENCGEVEVMGWLYQYYIAEKHDEVYAGFKKNKKAGAAEIGPATQLFTPHWIVRYLVENSLGRLWMLNFPDSGLAERMDYYIAPEEPEEDFLRIDSPEDITFLDPAMGSGHILVYAFDLLYDMYLEEGYRPAEIPTLILQKNLTGFEIDKRAAEIAAFALAIKAREKDAGFFDHAAQPDLTVFRSIHFDASELQDAGLISADAKLLDALAHLDEVGSLCQPDPADVILLDNASENLAKKSGLFASHALGNIADAAQVVDQLSRRFDVVVANPPYMGSGNMNAWLSGWVKDSYPDGNNDLCTCFIKRGLTFAKGHGYAALITMQSWMFLGSYEQMRKIIINHFAIESMAHLGTRAFDAIAGEVVSTTATVFRNGGPATKGTYIRLVDTLGEIEKSLALQESIKNPICGRLYYVDQQSFKSIPGWPIAYWASAQIIKAFETLPPLDTVANFSIGIKTGNNSQFLRYWWEISFLKMKLNASGVEDTFDTAFHWFPCNKGGSYRKWYGNTEFVIDWRDDGKYAFESAEANGNHAQNYADQYKFVPLITWSDITNNESSFRYKNHVLSETTGLGIYTGINDICALLGFLNSAVAKQFIGLLAPTIHLKTGELGKVPWLRPPKDSQLNNLVVSSVELTRTDWDAFETSWDFTRHPLVRGSLLSDAFDAWSVECRERFDTLKSNEEELNRIFARIYHMEGEVPIEVPDGKVSVRLADRKRDVKSLVSYAVGCMFGRYSLDVDGLVLADQGSTHDDYLDKVPNPTFMPDEDGILPITEEEWFPDDIVTEFDRWLKAAFGAEHFAENLAYVEEALGCKVREYFVKGKKSPFYDDHCKTYSVTGSGKRPIYWMFSSPKGSFNCLIYLHRYDERTVSTILTDYVRDLRRRLEVQVRGLEASEIAQERARADRYHDIIDELSDWERDVLYPMAQQHIAIDLDDGVRHNYKLFPGALRKVAGLS